MGMLSAVALDGGFEVELAKSDAIKQALRQALQLEGSTPNMLLSVGLKIAETSLGNHQRTSAAGNLTTFIEPNWEQDDYSNEELSEMARALVALAPFAEPGSYIEMRGDNDRVFRYVARDGKLYFVWGYISFDDPGEEVTPKPLASRSAGGMPRVGDSV